jgi:class 3 adenylate cyclase
MQKWLIKSEEKIVVAFDICSSTTIIEDLTLTNNVSKLLDVLDELKQLLYQKKQDLKFEPYKFVGDGWILLFPPNTSGQELIQLLHLLSLHFATRFKRYIEPILEVQPQIQGLTFGVDVGLIHRVRMFGVHEYIGRPLNVACRLQGAIKDDEVASPADKVLVSHHCYEKYFAGVGDINRYNPTKTSRQLRNIREGKNFDCLLLSFLVDKFGV